MKAFNLKAKTVMFGQAQAPGILLGEEGRNRTARKIRMTESIPDGSGACYSAPKIGFGMIAPAEAISDRWLARISTKAAYVRGAWGNLSQLSGGSVKRLASGEGRFGDAGAIGRWEDSLLYVPDGEVVRVKPSRGTPYFLVFEEGSVDTFSEDDWKSMGRSSERSDGWEDIPDA